jgi:hypothetical protein
MLSINGKSTGTRVLTQPITANPKKPTQIQSQKVLVKTKLVPIEKKEAPQLKKSLKSKQPGIIVEKNKKSTKEKTVKEIAEERLFAPDQYNQEKVTIRFNHYKKEFQMHNRVLKWTDVDEEYAISFVYRGNYVRRIYHEDINDITTTNIDRCRHYQKSDENYFLLDSFTSNLKEYWLELIEDESAGCGIEGLVLRKGPILANNDFEKSGHQSGNFAVNDITNQLKSMDVKDLHSDEARRLREARDIEDILYS